MVVGKYNFTIKQGNTFYRKIIYTDNDDNVIDLTGYTAALQIRDTYTSEVLLELTTENGGITITGAEGKIELNITKTQTAALTFCKAIYDLDIYSGSYEYTLFEGTVRLNKQVTR